MNANNKKYADPRLLFATAGGIGYLPFARGTAASAAALLLLFISGDYRWILTSILLLLGFSYGIKYISYAESIFGEGDKRIVIDELLGMTIVLSNPFIDYNLLWIAISLIIFRVYDVLKIYPANRLNDRTGAVYVLLDDVAAGLICLFLLQIIHWFYEIIIIITLAGI